MKKRVNLFLFSVLLLMVVLISINFISISINFISASAVGDFFNGFKGKSKLLSSPEQIYFTGLPDNFRIILGLYHPFDNGRVILCGPYGKCYISKDGLNFQEFTEEEMTAVDLPQNFEPRVGFYHPFGGDGGRIVLSNGNGVTYVYNPSVNRFEPFTSEMKTAVGLPSNFVPKAGYWHNLSGDGGRIVFFGNSKVYVARSDSIFVGYNPADFDLPSNEMPYAAYYYEFADGKKGVELWYEINGEAKLYKYDRVTGKFVLINFNGLPSDFIPITGYFDKINNKIIVFGNDKAFYSDDGINFVPVIMGEEQRISICDQQCQDIIRPYAGSEANLQKILSFSESPSEECSSIIGDLNNDNKVNAVDVQLMINIALGINQISSCADVDANGVVDAVDVQKIINLALGFREDSVDVSVATLKKYYKIREKIELTDPPEEISPKNTPEFSIFNSDITSNVLNYQGYIIEFNLDPLVKAKKKWYSFTNPKAAIEKEHRDVKEKIRKKLLSSSLNSKAIQKSNNQLKVLGEYTKVFNGIALDVSSGEAKEIEKIKGVKRVYPNYKVEAMLYDSVPLINADDVWKIDKDGNNCIETSKDCLTGKGIKIGVIDTGVDYIHQDLGGNGIYLYRDERLLASGYEKLQYYNGKIYAICGDTYCQFDLDKMEETKIKLPINEEDYLSYSLGTPSVYENKLGYQISFKSEGKEVFEFHIMNLITNEDVKLLIEFKEMENYQLFGNYLVFSYKFGSDSFKNIYLYNINTNNLLRITDDTKDFVLPKIYQDRVVFLSSFGEFFNTMIDKIYVYNIISEETRIIEESFREYDSSRIIDFDLIFGKINKYGVFAYQKKTSETNELKIFDLKTNTYKTFYNDPERIFILPFVSNDKVIYSDGNNFYLYDKILNKEIKITLYGAYGEGAGIIDDYLILPKRNGDVFYQIYDSNYDYSIGSLAFNDKVVDGWNFVTCAFQIFGFCILPIQESADPMDDNGHGTHVVATISGSGDLKGVAPDAEIIAYKVLDSQGSGSINNIMAAIERSIDPNQDGDFSDHLDIISLSLGIDCNSVGGYSSYCGPDDIISTVIDNVVGAGVVAVIAAGNSGSDEGTISSPGTARKAITVGAVDKNNLLVEFSSKGPIIWNDGRVPKSLVKPDIVAPGVLICAARLPGFNPWEHNLLYSLCLDEEDGEHVKLSGTSMATPHVSGVVALIKQAHPDWSPEEIKMALKNTALNINEDIISQGRGRVDALSAVSLDKKPLIAELIEINTYVSDRLDIYGTSKGESFEKYEVYYSKKELDNWNFVCSGNKIVDENLLCQNFDISFFDEGDYKLKLIVYGSDLRKSEDSGIFSIGDIPPELVIPQSKIVNNQDKEVSGILTINILEFTGTKWDIYRVVYQEQINVPANGIIKLDKIFNPLKISVDKVGLYKIYVSFKTNDKVFDDEWEFRVIPS